MPGDGILFQSMQSIEQEYRWYCIRMKQCYLQYLFLRNAYCFLVWETDWLQSDKGLQFHSILHSLCWTFRVCAFLVLLRQWTEGIGKEKSPYYKLNFKKAAEKNPLFWNNAAVNVGHWHIQRSIYDKVTFL